MTSPLEAYHPELILVGAAATAVGLLAGRARRGIELEAAVVAVACWAALAGHTEPAAAAAAALLAVGSGLRARAAPARLVGTDIGVCLLALAFARPDADGWAIAMVLVTAAGAMAVLRDGSAPLAPVPALLLLASCAATFGGAPDTELAVAAGSTVGLVALVAACTRRFAPDAAAPVLIGWAAPGYLALSAVDSYRGRTAGLPAAAVACAAIVVATLVAARAAGRARPPVLVAAAVAVAAALGAARTFGLWFAATPGSIAAGLGLAVLVVGAGWWATRLRVPDEGRAAPAPARTPPA